MIVALIVAWSGQWLCCSHKLREKVLRTGTKVPTFDYQEMWSKISNALKSHSTTNKGEQTLSVMSKVFEQHPNLSIFHANESGVLHSSPPPSPSVHSKGDMFKRMSKGPSKDDAHDADSQQAIGTTDLMPSILACDSEATASVQIAPGVSVSAQYLPSHRKVLTFYVIEQSAHNFGVSTSVSPLEISVLPSVSAPVAGV